MRGGAEMSSKKIKKLSVKNFTRVIIENPIRKISCKRTPKGGFKCNKCGYKQKTLRDSCKGCGVTFK